MSDPVAQIIIWCSPVMGLLIAWFITNHISDTKDEVTKLGGRVGRVESEISDVKIEVVKVQTKMENLKDIFSTEKKKQDEFENGVVKILKEARGRFK